MRKNILKIASICLILLQSGILKAQQILEINDGDLIKVKELMRKNILVKDEKNELKLNEQLKEKGLVETVESMNATNCVGTITD